MFFSLGTSRCFHFLSIESRYFPQEELGEEFLGCLFISDIPIPIYNTHYTYTYIYIIYRYNILFKFSPKLPFEISLWNILNIMFKLVNVINIYILIFKSRTSPRFGLCVTTFLKSAIQFSLVHQLIVLTRPTAYSPHSSISL